MLKPVLVIHGGAGRKSKDPRRTVRVREKLSKILNSAYKRLLEINAVEAVTHAVRLLEDDPEFNAGTGSRLQADGQARLSASLMDGKSERFAAVINLEKIKNPVLIARALLSKNDRVLAGQGAFEFAKKIGLKPTDPRTKEAILNWKKWREKSYDTVGACALDRYGNLASATSTGGRGFETPGRVSDSGMPVANFADRLCAISATGIGEDIIDEGLAIKIATRVRDGSSLRAAFQKTFREVRSRERKMGAIGIDRKGNVVWETTTETLLYAWRQDKKEKIF
ncbi:MAG: isoaspartyl peptidase/L-asparaginase [Candidatus Omnitrophota bacterium]